MNIRQINSEIMHGNWSNEELTLMIEAIKWRRAQLAKSVKNKLRLGDQVSFNSQKMGGPVTGTVESIKVKFATVNTARGRWRVPINMLEAI
jgi:hypothetical protein